MQGGQEGFSLLREGLSMATALINKQTNARIPLLDARHADMLLQSLDEALVKLMGYLDTRLDSLITGLRQLIKALRTHRDFLAASGSESVEKLGDAAQTNYAWIKSMLHTVVEYGANTKQLPKADQMYANSTRYMVISKAAAAADCVFTVVEVLLRSACCCC